MTAAQLWEQFQKSGLAEPGAGYEAWSFGDDPDRLLKLVLFGEKTATAGLYCLYEHDREPLPRVGEYNVLLDSQGAAKCITRTTAVYITPFDRVSTVQACKEGEGDKTLDYWRRVHKRFFTKELQAVGLEFSEELPVVCEEFELIYQEETERK